ncbi:MlaD family protein [Patulibacter defluvii]|uniref:MlaD family protein n=1 Tax=Patulibacter defluvii TaxID=3095358 RepID=UPI002A76388C|nr:MlaD family protein [Patulibacter sp. DM4]
MKLRSDRLALELKRARVPFLLVLFMIGCALIAGWYMFRQQKVQWFWQDTQDVKVAFDDVKGVQPGQQDVRLAGVSIGLIKDAQVGKDGKAVLTLSLEKKYGDIYKNARMRLRPVTPLQDMYVSIETRGTPSAGKLAGDDVLALQRTASPVDISRVLNTFDPDTRTRLASLLTDMGKGLGDHGDELRRSFVALAPFLQAADRLTGAMADRRREIARVVHNLGQLTAAVNTRDQQLSSLIQQGNGTLAELAQHDSTLSATLAELPPTMTQMRSSFGELRAAEDELDPALRSLRPVAEKLKPGLEALQEVSRDAMPALRALQPAMTQLRPLAEDLQPTSVALKDAFARLAPTTPRLDRATQKIVPCRLAIGKFFQWTLSVLKYYDGGGAYPRGELVLGMPSFTLGKGKDPVLRRGWTCTQGGPPK